MVLESQLPHKIVSLLFTITDSKQLVDNLVGELTFSSHLMNTLCEIRSVLERQNSKLSPDVYRGTSLARNSPPVGPCSSPMPRDLG